MSHEIRNGKILVLGSRGLVGRDLLEWLWENEYNVLEVKNRRHIDLRIPGALDVFDNETISFVFFLACEVGGSKYIDSSKGNTQLNIIESNIKIYQVVFPWLAKKKIPFLFTSSYLQSIPNSYGSIKRIGENWIQALGFGKIVRLWNVYGYELIGEKSHVLGDWINSCLQTGQIKCRTNGRETRQFLHGKDCASALGMMMKNYDEIDKISDLSSGKWTSLRKLASIVQKHAGISCPVTYATKKGATRLRINPKLEVYFHYLWKPKLSLDEGIALLFKEYKSKHQKQKQEEEGKRCDSKPTQAVIIDPLES